MRSRLLLIVALLVTPLSVFAQEPEAAEAPPAIAVQAPTDQQPLASPSYLIELVEFRFNEAPSASLTAEDILGRLRQPAAGNGVEVIQTFHLLAVAGQESMAKVEVQTAVTSGVAYPQGRGGPAPPIRHLQQMKLGTTLTAKVQPVESKILVEVRYSASRIEGERPEDGPPDIVAFTLQSQLLIAPGQQTLLGGASGTSSSYAVLSVTEQ